jgi:hypothetical protein
VLVGCSLVSGLFARSLTAGPDGFRGRSPILLCGLFLDALDIRRVVLVPGLTGSPSRHMVLATSFARPRLIFDRLQAAAEPSAGAR